tara:strand:- start:381 stop:1427 length:1047 start_codon:yes stop_codon:yes gene_type:complete
LGLNGLRAIAVLMVLLSHFLVDFSKSLKIPIGVLGVDIFFVLSGYLISRILFHQLRFFDPNKISRINICFRFLKRRASRIFPIYYLTLLVLIPIAQYIQKDYLNNIFWYLSYTSNFLTYKSGEWFGPFAHLWSLAVEEQFYLFWPFLIFFIIPHRLKVFLIITIVFSTLFPFFNIGFVRVHTLSSLNLFTIGGLLSYYEIFESGKIQNLGRLGSYFFWITLSLILTHYYVYAVPYFSTQLFFGIIAMYLVYMCRWNDQSFFVKKILEHPLLFFLGSISYGIYLYHNFVPVLFNLSLDYFEVSKSFLELSVLRFSIYCSITILISYLSYRLFEHPILTKGLKYRSYSRN